VNQCVPNNNRSSSTWDPITDQRIKNLDPRLQQGATNFINSAQKSGTKLRIVQGYRSSDEQDRLYQQGRTTPGPVVTYAKGGQSYHNYGLAFDVARVDSKGNIDWKKPIDSDTAQYAKNEGFEWGGDWAAPKTDNPHFQMTFGESWSDLQSKK
jgi:LAS superfamily LD-carboxypeptidase LdcB